MAVWKQFVVVLGLAVVAALGWGAVDPSARERLLAFGVPAVMLPQALFLASGEETAGVEGPGGPASAGGRSRPGFGGGPVTVVAARAALRTTNDRVRAIGTAEAAKAVVLRARSAGIVEAVEFSPGDHVDADAVLVRLDDEAEQIALEQAEISLATQEARLERFNRLAASSAVSAAERDDAAADVAAALLAVREAQLALDRRHVLAPFAGFVGLSEVEVGDLLAAQTEIATLDDRSELSLTFRVPESVASKVAIGQTVKANTPSRPDEVFEGEVSAIGSRIEADSRTLAVEARIANVDDRLRPGMSFLVDLRFPGDQQLAVPALALQWDRDGSFIWRVSEGKAERVAVTLVERESEVVLVDGDLAEGDVIVVEGVQRLRPGSAVALAGEPASPSDKAAPRG